LNIDREAKPTPSGPAHQAEAGPDWSGMGTPVSPEALAAADDNFARTWCGVLSFAPLAREHVSEDLVLIFTGEPVALFNRAFVLSPPEDPGTTVDGVATYFGEFGVPFAIYARDEVCPGFAEACSTRGLVERWSLPLMVLEPLPESTPAGPVDLEITDLDGKNADEYMDVLNRGFGMPRDLCERMLRRPAIELADFTGFIGSVDGEAVAASGLFMTDDTAGVYNVATLPEWRGRGYGAAMTWHAVLAGRRLGASRSVLQASAAGEPVYARMGFTTPSYYRQFEGEARH
jgi:GNAT superfamily N-acetyltransferase